MVRVSARKARLVADLIRGREVGEALEILQFTRKKTAPLLKNLVESAVANAEFKAERDGGKVEPLPGVDSTPPLQQRRRCQGWRQGKHRVGSLSPLQKFQN